MRKPKLNILRLCKKTNSNGALCKTGQGLGESREGAAKLAQIAGCSDVWQQVLELAREVSRQNQLNGELIQHRLQHNQQMLNIIREAAGTPLTVLTANPHLEARELIQRPEEVCMFDYRSADALNRLESVLLVIDIQERLRPAIAHADSIVANSEKLAQVSHLLEIPALITEQYPQGLGHTAASLKEHFDPRQGH